MRLWSRNPQVLDPEGSLLTNRMSELFTYGSVGGVGRKPGPYPAIDGQWRSALALPAWFGLVSRVDAVGGLL